MDEDETRQRMMRALQTLGDFADRQLAKEFEVAVSTVGRWRRGTAKPHVRVANLIYLRAVQLGGQP